MSMYLKDALADLPPCERCDDGEYDELEWRESNDTCFILNVHKKTRDLFWCGRESGKLVACGSGKKLPIETVAIMRRIAEQSRSSKVGQGIQNEATDSKEDRQS
jgi:hypothetical protein